MTKTIVNVYKDYGLWKKPAPGIGDFLRGCCYLQWRSRQAGGGERFAARFNLDLSPASSCLSYPAVYFPGDRQTLSEAPEYFDLERDGEVEEIVDEFLRSDRETLYLSTNRSWRGVDEEPDREALALTAQILNFTPEFQASLVVKLRNVPKSYTLLHIRDRDRTEPGAGWFSWDAWKFRYRANQFIKAKIPLRSSSGAAVVCVSNNVSLRNQLCQRYGYINTKTDVKNTGFKGILSEGELIDVAIMKNASALVALSYFEWNSGFSVWVTRLFGVPALFYNAKSLF